MEAWATLVLSTDGCLYPSPLTLLTEERIDWDNRFSWLCSYIMAGGNVSGILQGHSLTQAEEEAR